jgi:hypothetical protein
MGAGLRRLWFKLELNVRKIETRHLVSYKKWSIRQFEVKDQNARRRDETIKAE